jgi:hypothetical protein
LRKSVFQRLVQVLRASSSACWSAPTATDNGARLSTEERTRLGTERPIGKPAPGRGLRWYSESFMPFLPSLFRKQSCRSILKHPAELFNRYILPAHGHIRRRAVNHQVGQKCIRIGQRLLRLVIPDHFSCYAQEVSRIRNC